MSGVLEMTARAWGIAMAAVLVVALVAIYATRLGFAPIYLVQVLPLSESAVRLPTALVGVLNVLLVVWLARRLFGDPRLAIAAGAMLAFSPGHFIHSRMALSVLYPVPFVILWLIALRKVDQGNSDRWLFAGGAALGAGVYAYLASVVMDAPLPGANGGAAGRTPQGRIQSAATGSLAVVAADEPLASSLDRNGWRRAAVAAEPTGVPSFIVFQKP